MQGKDSKERDCLSFEGFCACVRIDISHRLEHAKVRIQEVIKNNGIRLHGVVIREQDGSDLVPIFYLEGFYEQYQDGNMGLEEIVDTIIMAYRTDKTPLMLDSAHFSDWGQVKERIVFRLINMDSNREYLEHAPHFQYLDLALAFTCYFGNAGDTNLSIAVNSYHMDMWGVTAEELCDVAEENTFRLLEPKIQHLGEYLGIQADASEGFYAGLPQDALSTGILTNGCKFNGAVGILDKRLLKGFSDRVGSDLYILPSSVHELILLPTTCGKTVEELNAMVSDLNANLEEVTVLSNHVYRYIRETGEVTM